MNLTIMCGRCTRDAEVRYSTSGMGVARFTLAIDRPKKDEQEQTADFISCVAFGKTAESAEKFFKKGTKLIIRGHIATGSYTDNDGKKVYTTDNVVDTWEFAESKKSEGMGAINAPIVTEEDGWSNIPEGLDEQLPFAQPTR